MPKTDHDTDFAELLAGFDYQRWSIACREMQVRIMRGDLPAAHEVIDVFARFTGYAQATMQSSLAAVLPIRLANQLEAAGYHTLHAIAATSDERLLRDVGNFGTVNLDIVRNCIARIQRGEVLEQYEEDDELLDEACFIRRLPTCQCENETMVVGISSADRASAIARRTDTATNSDQVLAALELLSSSPDTAAEVIDARIAEVEAEVKRLRKMRKLLGTKPKSKKPSASRETIEEEIYQHVLKHGPTKPGEIGEALGLTAIAVGQSVAQSTRLGKQGYKVVVE